MSKIRVAVASSGVDHVKRGIETWAVDLTRALRERGLEACLFQGSGESSGHRVTVPCLPRGQHWNTRLARFAPRFFWRARLKSPYDIEQTTFAIRLLLSGRAAKFDILHTQDPHVARVLDVCHKAGLFRPKVLLAHGTEEPPEYLAKFSYLQHLAPQHSEEIRSFQKPGTKWFVGPNFVDTKRFYPGKSEAIREKLNIPQGAFVVITSAAVKRHHKRIDYLLDEFAQFERQFDGDAHLVIAGASTTDTDQLREQAQRLGLDTVHFLVDQPHEQMPDILRVGDLFVLCSLKEMMPIALLEAIATGLPALVSEHPVVSWMKGDGGESLPMAAGGALADAMQAWSQPDRLAAVSKRARAHAEAEFSESAVLDTLNGIYAEVIA